MVGMTNPPIRFSKYKFLIKSQAKIKFLSKMRSFQRQVFLFDFYKNSYILMIR